MYLINSITALFSLKWRKQQPMLRPLPPFIRRTLVKTADGDLEVLIAEPNPSTTASRQAPTQPPIFFAHGGYGSAGVWLEWMTYLHNHDYTGTLYAYSARNHGASYTLPYWRMVYYTSFADIQIDMVACLEYANAQEAKMNSTARRPIIVGHSSGGGLSQYLLSGVSPDSGLRVKASGLCLVDAIPSYGSYDIYWNWLKHDPWFTVRQIVHLQHPTSPLSTERLVHGAFFGHKFPIEQTAEFTRWMPAYESMGWPIGMVGNRFWGWATRGQNMWLSCRDICSNLQGGADGHDRACVMVGKEDMMYREHMWERQCAEYREGFRLLKEEEKVEKAVESKDASDQPVKATSVKSKGGVRLVLVEDSGHHVQNDVYCDQAAELFLRWANQV